MKAEDIKNREDIAYKAGYEECNAKWLPIINKIREENKQAGRKEVVEEIIKDKDIPIRYSHNATCYDCLKQMKEKYIGKPN